MSDEEYPQQQEPEEVFKEKKEKDIKILETATDSFF